MIVATIGTGYLIKKTLLSGSQLLHNPTSWTYWALKNLKGDVEIKTILDKEIELRYSPDKDKTLAYDHILKQIDYEHNCLRWFCRITSTTAKLHIGWVFEVQEQDIILVQQALAKLAVIRTLLEHPE
jgi:hypothetical protein